MMNEMPDSDGFSEIRDFWQVLADVIIQRKLTLLGEQNCGKGRKLLGDRGDMKNG
jgi:hypothetical protein